MAPEQSEESERKAMIARQTDVMIRLATNAERLTEAVEQLRAQIAGSPNLLERVSAGHVRNALGALLIVVSLSAIVGTATAFVWRDSWETASSK